MCPFLVILIALIRIFIGNPRSSSPPSPSPTHVSIVREGSMLTSFMCAVVYLFTFNSVIYDAILSFSTIYDLEICIRGGFVWEHSAESEVFLVF